MPRHRHPKKPNRLTMRVVETERFCSHTMKGLCPNCQSPHAVAAVRFDSRKRLPTVSRSR